MRELFAKQVVADAGMGPFALLRMTVLIEHEGKRF
jgi:hypothetical protein